MDFVWNDGGRAACGFVGHTGDCVTRSIAIATGKVYRDVYQSLGERAGKTPRNGLHIGTPSDYLSELGWLRHEVEEHLFAPEKLPKGIVICDLAKKSGRSGHFSTVIDHVVHDTWNPADDERYSLERYWTPPESADSTLPIPTPGRRVSEAQEFTQREFEKILRRLRALDNTANNGASTEGEKRNAIRMMQQMMLTHNMTREDIIDDDNVENVQFTRRACPVNGRRACTWEGILAWYVTEQVFPTVQFYRATKGHRTLFWFYGPLDDVENSISLFRELLVTIASAATLQYGGYSRGSGASYAEGYVSGLPRASQMQTYDQPADVVSKAALIHTRTLALHSAARDWLSSECDIKLSSGSRSGRGMHDFAAENRGKQHGAKQQVSMQGRRKRIGQR